MKKLALVALLLAGGAFAQFKFTVGAFHKELTYLNASNSVLIGMLPPNAYVESIRLYNSQTAPDATTNTLTTVGISGSETYFTAARQTSGPLSYGLEVTPFATSNAGKILSTTAPTPIYAKFVYNTASAAAGTSNFKIRVSVTFVQN